MEKVIWSSNGDLDNILSLSADDKRNVLSDMYDDEMVTGLSDDELDGVISDDPSLYDNAMEDFEQNIAPMIASQFFEGLVLNTNFNLVSPEKLLDIEGLTSIVEDDNGDLSIDVNGNTYPVLGFSEDPSELVKELEGLDILSSLKNLYPEKEDEEFADLYYFEDMIPYDWDILSDNLKRAKNLNKGVEESLTEAKAKNPNKLADELAEIKDLAEEYGYEYFTQMPFTSYDNDPISIEVQYPEFFRVVKAFFKEMNVLTPEELGDNDELDFQWDQGLDQHDWDVLMRTCDKLVQGKNVQIEKEYKTGYNSVLDDDEILASREQEESLNEDLDIKLAPKLEKLLGSKKDEFINTVKKLVYNKEDYTNIGLYKGWDDTLRPEVNKKREKIYRFWLDNFGLDTSKVGVGSAINAAIIDMRNLVAKEKSYKDTLSDDRTDKLPEDEKFKINLFYDWDAFRKNFDAEYDDEDPILDISFRDWLKQELKDNGWLYEPHEQQLIKDMIEEIKDGFFYGPDSIADEDLGDVKNRKQEKSLNEGFIDKLKSLVTSASFIRRVMSREGKVRGTEILERVNNLLDQGDKDTAFKIMKNYIAKDKLLKTLGDKPDKTQAAFNDILPGADKYADEFIDRFGGLHKESLDEDTKASHIYTAKEFANWFDNGPYGESFDPMDRVYEVIQQYLPNVDFKEDSETIYNKLPEEAIDLISRYMAEDIYGYDIDLNTNESLNESSNVIDQKGFATLIKYDDPVFANANYGVLNDGNFCYKFWADDDEEAKQVFAERGTRVNESMIKRNKLREDVDLGAVDQDTLNGEIYNALADVAFAVDTNGGSVTKENFRKAIDNFMRRFFDEGALEEDTETWPWGDPNKELPRRRR